MISFFVRQNAPRKMILARPSQKSLKPQRKDSKALSLVFF